MDNEEADAGLLLLLVFATSALLPSPLAPIPQNLFLGKPLALNSLCLVDDLLMTIELIEKFLQLSKRTVSPIVLRDGI